MADQGSTRARIVETADRLFYEYGFAPTSFADIAADVGISRGNFYHHFRTKDAILEDVIDLRLTRTSQMLAHWEEEGDSPKHRIEAFIAMLIGNKDKIMEYGCPVGTLCAEMAKLDHDCAARATDIFALFRDWLTSQFRVMGAEEKDAEALAIHALMRSQGIAMLAAAFKDEALLRREVADFENWLSQIGATLEKGKP